MGDTTTDLEGAAEAADSAAGIIGPPDVPIPLVSPNKALLVSTATAAPDARNSSAVMINALTSLIATANRNRIAAGDDWQTVGRA
jgi:hypothetical protein